MKQLLLKAIACSALLLPLGTLEAKGTGFKPGKTFTFTVETRLSTQASLSGNKSVPVPKDVPKYAVGQKVKFTIGPKGELTAKNGLNIPYKADGGSAFVYTNASTATAKKGKINTGQVFKNSKKVPYGVALQFIRRSGSGLSTKTTTVTYTLR